MFALLILAGIGYSVVTPSSNKAVMTYFRENIRATAMGFKQTGISGGGFLAGIILPPVALLLNWHWALMLAGLIVLGKPVIQVFFERGAFDAFSAEMTNRALFFYALGLIAFSGMRVAVSAFYALQDTKTPVKIAAVAFATNLLLSIFFMIMTPLKHGGLALALSMASTLQFCLLIYFLKKRVEILDIRSIIVSAAKSFFAAAIMGSAIYGMYVLSWAKSRPVGLMSTVFHLMGLVFVGVIIYVIFARVFGCRELGSVAEMFRPFIKKRKWES